MYSYQAGSVLSLKLFQKHDGVFHAMLDGWTAPNVLSMIGLVIQYVDNNELRSFLLDMIPLSISHTGQNMANVLVEVFDEYGILEKVRSLRCCHCCWIVLTNVYRCLVSLLIMPVPTMS